MSECVYNYIVTEEYPKGNLNHFDIENISTIGVYKENSENFEKDFFEYWCDYFDVDDIKESEYYPQVKRAFEILATDNFATVCIEVEDYNVWIRKIKEMIR